MSNKQKLKKDAAIGIALASLGGGLVVAGMYALLGWPGAAIAFGLLLFAAGLWAAIMAISTVAWIEVGEGDEPS